MGALSTAYDNHALDALLGDAHASTWPATVFIGLSTTAPAKDGTNVTEPSGGSYARVSVANTTAQWPAASAASKSNGAVLTFPTATGAWGTVGYWVMYDLVTAGVLMAFGSLNPAVAVTSGTPPTFPIGALILGAD